MCRLGLDRLTCLLPCALEGLDLGGSMLAKARCQDQLGSQPCQGPGIFAAMWLGLLCLLGWFLWTRSLQDQLGSVPEEAELL